MKAKAFEGSCIMDEIYLTLSDFLRIIFFLILG